MSLSWMKTKSPTAIERAFDLCKASLVVIFVLSFFVNLLALTVPLYLLQVYDHVLSSRSLDTLVMLTVIVAVALAAHASLEALRREMLTRIGTWLDDRLRASVLIASVQSALRNDQAAAAQAWRDLSGLRAFFAGTACTALFDLPWMPIFIVALMVIHPLLGVIGLVAAAILFGLAILASISKSKSLSSKSGMVHTPRALRPLRQTQNPERTDRSGDPVELPNTLSMHDFPSFGI